MVRGLGSTHSTGSEAFLPYQHTREQPERKRDMRMWKSLSVALGVLGIVALAYLPFGAAQEEKSIEQMLTEAKTPADHEAIAAYYDKEAQEAHSKHAEHQKMKEWYKN